MLSKKKLSKTPLQRTVAVVDQHGERSIDRAGHDGGAEQDRNVPDVPSVLRTTMAAQHHKEVGNGGDNLLKNERRPDQSESRDFKPSDQAVVSRNVVMRSQY